jgi:hypothetical protein
MKFDKSIIGGKKPVTPQNEQPGTSYETSGLENENAPVKPVTLMSGGDIATGAMIVGTGFFVSNPIVFSLITIGLVKLNTEATATDDGTQPFVDEYDDKGVDNGIV